MLHSPVGYIEGATEGELVSGLAVGSYVGSEVVGVFVGAGVGSDVVGASKHKCIENERKLKVFILD